MKIKFLGLMLGGLMLVAGSAQAALLSVTGGDNTQAINAGFSLTSETGLSVGDPLIAFNTANAGSGGLSLIGAGTLVFEFLGSEAGFANTFEVAGGEIFSNLTSLVGDTASVALPDGLVDFAFLTTGGGGGQSAANGGPISAGLSFAFAAISDTSLIVLFGDGTGDLDRDDLAVRVSVSQVPLPAAVWLLLSALVGLVSFSRIRRSGGQTA